MLSNWMEADFALSVITFSPYSSWSVMEGCAESLVALGVQEMVLPFR